MASGNANQHISVNTVLMFVMAFLHFASVGSVLLNILGMAVDLPWSQPAHGGAELAGQVSVYVVAGVTALLGVVWAPLNAYALIRRKPWAQKSTLAYWAFTDVFCCCLPGAAYGLWSLTRDDVKAQLDS